VVVDLCLDILVQTRSVNVCGITKETLGALLSLSKYPMFFESCGIGHEITNAVIGLVFFDNIGVVKNMNDGIEDMLKGNLSLSHCLYLAYIA
jgi:hypothetical protein